MNKEDAILEGWISQKPDYACVFLTRNKWTERWEYDIYSFEWVQGEPPDDRPEEDEGTRYYYLGWFDKDGDEIDHIDGCAAKEFLIVEILPTQEEVHKEWIKSIV